MIGGMLLTCVVMFLVVQYLTGLAQAHAAECRSPGRESVRECVREREGPRGCPLECVSPSAVKPEIIVTCGLVGISDLCSL